VQALKPAQSGCDNRPTKRLEGVAAPVSPGGFAARDHGKLLGPENCPKFTDPNVRFGSKADIPNELPAACGGSARNHNCIWMIEYINTRRANTNNCTITENPEITQVVSAAKPTTFVGR
jgi:hypothetical protein